MLPTHSESTSTDVLQLLVGLFEASPGQTLLTELTALAEQGGSTVELARLVADSALFLSPYYYPATLTDRQFAERFLQRLLDLGEGYDFDAPDAAAPERV